MGRGFYQLLVIVFLYTVLKDGNYVQRKDDGYEDNVVTDNDDGNDGGGDDDYNSDDDAQGDHNDNV